MDEFLRGTNETDLLDLDVGYEVLDAIVQANVDLKKVTRDELNQMVVHFSTSRNRKAVARLIRNRKRPRFEDSLVDGPGNPHSASSVAIGVRRRHQGRRAISREND